MNTATQIQPIQAQASSLQKYENVIGTAAQFLPYASLVLVFLWFGGMKFTQYEAEAISGLITNSPLVSFLGPVLGTQGSSILIGCAELTIAACLALRIVSARIAVIGAVGAIATFAITFSFFFSTPGVFMNDVGSFAISVLPGQFLLKDIALLALAVVVLNDSIKAVLAE